MKLVIVALAFVAYAYADVSELGYNYEQPHSAIASAPIHPPKNTYIPPAEPKNTYIPPSPPVQAAQLSQPINPPSSSYIPPAPEPPKNSYIPPSSGEADDSSAQDGYRYKTIRRVVYKHRN